MLATFSYVSTAGDPFGLAQPTKWPNASLIQTWKYACCSCIFQVCIKHVSADHCYVREEWAKFGGDFAMAERAVAVAEGGYAFAYVEGELTRAVREGQWLLLDEVNLGPPEVSFASMLALDAYMVVL